MPERPAQAFSNTSAALLPSGDTTPIPVTATRLMASCREPRSHTSSKAPESRLRARLDPCEQASRLPRYFTVHSSRAHLHPHRMYLRGIGTATPPSRYTKAECLCLLYTSPSPRDGLLTRMPSSA